MKLAFKIKLSRHNYNYIPHFYNFYDTKVLVSTGVAENYDLETCHGYPTLSDNIEDINDMVFQGQKLGKGWLIDGVESGDILMVNWVMREQQDCVDDVKALARDLHKSMRQRYASFQAILKISTMHLILRNYLPASLVKGILVVK